jgi:carboxyl-terminal processing protease
MSTLRLLRSLAALSFCVLSTSQLFAQTPSTNAVDLATQANAAYAAKQYARSAQLYQQAVDLTHDADRANNEYNEACSLALAGEKDHALTVLAQAIEDGWGDRDHIAIDTDLVSLHSDVRWPSLLNRIDSNKKMQDQRWGTAAFKTPYAEDLSDADKVSALSLLWAQARFGFANFWHVPDLNWDEAYKSYLPKVLATKSTAEFYDVLIRFYALLQDGHTGVWPPGPLQTVSVPFQTRLIDGRVLVIGAYDTKFDMQGILPGDELVAINGQPVSEWARERVAPYVSASSPQDRDERLYHRELLQAKAGTVFHLKFQTPSGKEVLRDFLTGSHGPTPNFDFKLLSGNIAYVALNEFGDNVDADQWDKHWPEIAKSSTLILDLRRNGGGDDSVGAHILATLIDKPVPGSKAESPEWIATYRAWGQAQPTMHFPLESLAPDPNRHFAGKVLLLTSANTFSAAEDAVVLFATSKRGLIVGEPSGGSTGQPLLFNLPGGGMARVCTKHDSFPDGKEFVGIGVQPDIAAHITREDLLHGTDSVLAAALKAAAQP